MLLFLIFLDANEFQKKLNQKNSLKKVVTFYKNESKEVLKHTVSYFKEENVPVRTIFNIVAKYRQHNLTSYLPKSARPKKFLINSFKH